LLPAHVDIDSVQLWSQDETRVGQQGSLCRIWAKRGTRPRKVQQRQFLSTYIYGAANHETGQSFALILPYANTIAMNIFLQKLGTTIESGCHAAILIDNAGWHLSKELIIPANITLIPLPPYSPELNAMEQVWEWIKKHHLSNQCYESYEAILNHTSRGWNAFSDNLALVKSIMHRDWVCLP
jgi:transposase